MSAMAVVTKSYFDGEKLHAQGPFTLEISSGKILQIHSGDVAENLRLQNPLSDFHIFRAPFVMPGLVEAHAHLFLNGAELDFTARKNYLKAPREEMLATGRRNIASNLAAGITLIRDAGDLHGINDELKSELAGYHGLKPELRSPGRAIRKAGGYGSFMATEVTDNESLVRAIRQRAESADDLKILLTGIIDFEKGEMKGGPQFDLAQTKLIVRTAREVGLKTYAHCSGVEGLKIAVEAGIDSIEHGFFMTREILHVMADKNIAWVPTFFPVFFQFKRPELAGWKPETVARLGKICANHFEHVAVASEMGVPVIPGSDAGSYGVPHGIGLIEELFFHRRAGIPVEKILASATSLPRRLWKCESADVKAGARANLILLDGSPFQDFANLRRVRGVLRHPSYGPVPEPTAAVNV